MFPHPRLKSDQLASRGPIFFGGERDLLDVPAIQDLRPRSERGDYAIEAPMQKFFRLLDKKTWFFPIDIKKSEALVRSLYPPFDPGTQKRGEKGRILALDHQVGRFFPNFRLIL